MEIMLLRRIFEKVVRPANVEREIAGFRLRMPATHPLPHYFSIFPHFNRNLGRIGKAVHRKYPSMSAIDIGANVGDSVAIMRSQSHFPILCIEGSPGYFELLRRNAK